MRKWMIWVAAMLVIAALMAVNAGTALSSPAISSQVSAGPKGTPKAPACVEFKTCGPEKGR